MQIKSGESTLLAPETIEFNLSDMLLNGCIIFVSDLFGNYCTIYSLRKQDLFCLVLFYRFSSVLENSYNFI